MRVLEGKLVDSGIKVGIVAARFMSLLCLSLLQELRTDL